MAEFNISGTQVSDLTNKMIAYDPGTVTLDGVTGLKEVEYVCTDYGKWLAYYRKVAPLKQAIDALVRWTIGKGFQTDSTTRFILDTIIGNGKESFNKILANLLRNYHICGDAYAEIIKSENGMLVNLKVLNPARMKVVFSNKGQIKRYEYLSSTKDKQKEVYQPEEIFHISRDRIGDEIHGTSLIEGLKDIVDMVQEAMKDQRTLMHRYVIPRIVWKLQADTDTEIDDFITKTENSTKYAENIYIPAEAAEHEILAIPQNATMNATAWIEALNRYFWQATGGTDIVIGASTTLTESSGKIKYLSFQQNVEQGQLDVEEAVGQQLGLEIDLEFPAIMENELISDNKKDGDLGVAQPNDFVAGRGQ